MFVEFNQTQILVARMLCLSNLNHTQFGLRFITVGHFLSTSIEHAMVAMAHDLKVLIVASDNYNPQSNLMLC